MQLVFLFFCFQVGKGSDECVADPDDEDDVEGHFGDFQRDQNALGQGLLLVDVEEGDAEGIRDEVEEEKETYLGEVAAQHIHHYSIAE
jgi:hypothetical protein